MSRDLQESSVYEESNAIQRLREDLRICQTELRYATRSLGLLYDWDFIVQSKRAKVPPGEIVILMFISILGLSNGVVNFVCHYLLLVTYLKRPVFGIF